MNEQINSLNWFEIPVTDMARAKHFYQVIFSIHMQEDSMMGMQMASFPYAPGNGKVGGALVQSDFNKPGNEGILIYLNANPDLDIILTKVEGEGGKILVPKTLINEHIGYMAFILDTEGNRIGLHSQA